ncbi:MAG: hypothetical protein K8R91_02545, partial [Phycisphaerae bacterium]|nr:hypothetical protein [Phycisphaerae bacterium]
MNRKQWSKRIGIAALILGLAAVSTSILSAKPPRPKAHRVARRHAGARRVARRHKGLRRIPRRRRVMVRRVGTVVVVEQGGTVVQKAPVADIQSADALQAVPTVDPINVATYKVTKVSDDCSSVVITREGESKSVRLIGIAPIPADNSEGATG